VKIAVNNSFAYAALYKCGFAYTVLVGGNTGIAELVLERSAGEPAAGTRAEAGTAGGTGRAFRDGDRDLDPAEREFIAARDWGARRERRSWRSRAQQE